MFRISMRVLNTEEIEPSEYRTLVFDNDQRWSKVQPLELHQ